MSTEHVQDDRRNRRRFVLLWLVSALAVLGIVTVAVLASSRDGNDRRVSVDADGQGTAPVLDSPPVDVGSEPNELSDPNGTNMTTSGASATQPTPAASRSLARAATGGGSAVGPPREHGVRLQLTSTLSAPLRPGFARTLHIKVRNPNDFSVQLYRVDIRVLPPPPIGCLSAWVHTGRYRYTGGVPMQVGAQASTYVDLPIQLVNLLDVNQNACQNTAFPLNLTGIAVDPT